MEEISAPAARCGGRRSCALPLAVALLAGVLPAQAQTYPARPIKMIVPFPAGGGSDLVARTVAQKFHSPPFTVPDSDS